MPGFALSCFLYRLSRIDVVKTDNVYLFMVVFAYGLINTPQEQNQQTLDFYQRDRFSPLPTKLP